MRLKKVTSAILLSLFSCLLLQAKEVQVVFDATQDHFVQDGAASWSVAKGQVKIDGDGDNLANYQTEYRWYKYNRLTFSSPYAIKQIVFSKEGVNGNEKEDCSSIKIYKSKIGTITPNSDKSKATWKYSNGTKTITFENIDNSLWLGKIIVTVDVVDPDLVLDGSSVDAVNSGKIAELDGQKQLVVSWKRQFKADGGWYTLCLPFYRSWEQMRWTFGNDVEICQFESAQRQNDGKVQIVFSPVTDTYPIHNGVPYLIKPSKDTGEEIVFDGVTMHKDAPTPVEKDQIQFVGTFDPFEMTSGDSRYAFLAGSEGLDLAYPIKTSKVKGTRAYFVFPDGTAGVSEVVKVAEGDVSRVNWVIQRERMADEAYYTLSGLRLQGTPAQPGIYLHKGHKVVIR